jgi:DNA-binding XRE family transcriptional regulator
MRLGLVNKRNKLGLTHDEVAVKAHISRPYYTNIEAGRKDPSMKVMKRIADALNGTIDQLFFDQDVPIRNKRKSTA